MARSQVTEGLWKASALLLRVMDEKSLGQQETQVLNIISCFRRVILAAMWEQAVEGKSRSKAPRQKSLGKPSQKRLLILQTRIGEMGLGRGKHFEIRTSRLYLGTPWGSKERKKSRITPGSLDSASGCLAVPFTIVGSTMRKREKLEGDTMTSILDM